MHFEAEVGVSVLSSSHPFDNYNVEKQLNVDPFFNVRKVFCDSLQECVSLVLH